MKFLALDPFLLIRNDFLQTTLAKQLLHKALYASRVRAFAAQASRISDDSSRPFNLIEKEGNEIDGMGGCGDTIINEAEIKKHRVNINKGKILGNASDFDMDMIYLKKEDEASRFDLCVTSYAEFLYTKHCDYFEGKYGYGMDDVKGCLYDFSTNVLQKMQLHIANICGDPEGVKDTNFSLELNTTIGEWESYILQFDLVFESDSYSEDDESKEEEDEDESDDICMLRNPPSPLVVDPEQFSLFMEVYTLWDKATDRVLQSKLPKDSEVRLKSEIDRQRFGFGSSVEELDNCKTNLIRIGEEASWGQLARYLPQWNEALDEMSDAFSRSSAFNDDDLVVEGVIRELIELYNSVIKDDSSRLLRVDILHVSRILRRIEFMCYSLSSNDPSICKFSFVSGKICWGEHTLDDVKVELKELGLGASPSGKGHDKRSKKENAQPNKKLTIIDNQRLFQKNVSNNLYALPNKSFTGKVSCC